MVILQTAEINWKKKIKTRIQQELSESRGRSNTERSKRIITEVLDERRRLQSFKKKKR